MIGAVKRASPRLRAALLALGLLLGGMVTFLRMGWDDDASKELWRADHRLSAHPSEARVRVLLNVRADGAHAYLKMALVGRAFAEHPVSFRGVVASPRSQRERAAISLLASHGTRVFEYYPELQPEGFGEAFRRADWLKECVAEGEP